MMRTEERKQILYDMERKCLDRNFTLPDDNEDVTYCPPAWDNLLCWNYTRPGTIARQQCLGLDFLGLINGTAYRRCMSDGQWYVNPSTQNSFTNFSNCHPQHQTFSAYFQYHMRQIQLMANVGYSISLVVLTAAIIILVICRKPSRPTNSMRLNLFVAMAAKAALGLLKHVLFHEGLAFPTDLAHLPNGEILPKFTNASHWECKIMVTAHHYTWAAVYMWILAEGVFLHSIVYDTFKAGRNGVKPYILFGWLSPLTIIGPWVAVRIVNLNVACWNVTEDHRYHWILNGPILFTLCINMAFLVRIIKALFLRLHENSSRVVMGRKLAKFTLTLFLLFGAYYILFAVWPDNAEIKDAEIPKLYAEMFVNSFQGLFVSLVFCFFNDEIKSRLKSVILKRRSSSTLSYRRTNRPKTVASPAQRNAVKITSASMLSKKQPSHDASQRGKTARNSHDEDTYTTTASKRNGVVLLVKLNTKNKKNVARDIETL